MYEFVVILAVNEISSFSHRFRLLLGGAWTGQQIISIGIVRLTSSIVGACVFADGFEFRLAA